MTDEVRVWLVEREYDDKGLLRLVYATPDGERCVRMERSPHAGTETTAAMIVDADRLSAVEDDATRERYATETDRVAASNDPEDAI